MTTVLTVKFWLTDHNTNITKTMTTSTNTPQNDCLDSEKLKVFVKSLTVMMKHPDIVTK